MVALRKFETLIDLLTYFKDEQVCRDYLEMIRFDAMLNNINSHLTYDQLTSNK